MIQVNELRIGNWIKVGTTESVVDFLHDVSVGLQGNAIINNFRQVDPIPLTPGILQKFGFSKIMSNIPDLHQLLFNGYYNIRWDGLDGVSIETNGSGWRWLQPKIKSLHQLQNLYFSLTGIELKTSTP